MTWGILIAVLALAILFAPGAGLVAVARRWRTMRRRVLIEDALKFMFDAAADHQPASLMGLAGALGVPHRAVLRLVQQLEVAELARSRGDGVVLTETGTQTALHVLRAHRLLERYLADEAGMPLGRIHRNAERTEHRMSQEELEALDAHLGHPRFDPHGDPIPTVRGELEVQERVPLTDWPIDDPAEIVHVEDEPAGTMGHVLDAGVRPGRPLRVVRRDASQVLFVVDGHERALPPSVCANIHVRARPEPTPPARDELRLSQLTLGNNAEIVSLSDRCRGLTRRRLLDLGMTPGARVRAEMASPLKSARAYRVRDTLIALRKEQADLVRVRRAAG